MENNRPVEREQPYLTAEGRRRFTLGLPKGSESCRSLTLLTPEGVSILTSQGIVVVMESGIGNSIQYADVRYMRAGARLGTRADALGCDVVLTSERLSAEDGEYLQRHSVVLSLIPKSRHPRETIYRMLERGVTLISLDRIHDSRGYYPISDIIGEVNGRAAITSAVTMLSHPRFGKGLLLGGVAGVNPCEVVIIGTGMSALAAARSVIGLGGIVRLFDNDPYSLRRAGNELGPAVIGSSMHPSVLGHALASADVVVATATASRFGIDDSVLDTMKKGVIIFDLDDHDSISGTFPSLRCMDVDKALSINLRPGNNVCLINPIYVVRRTAAMALTNDIVRITDRLFGSGHGLINVLKTDVGLRNAVEIFRGQITDRDTASAVSRRWVDINLLLSFS